MVAMTLERDAKSKLTRTSTIGTLASKVKRPKACSATSLPLCVTEVVAPGKARADIASSRMPKAAAKTSFWLMQSDVSEVGRMGYVVRVFFGL